MVAYARFLKAPHVRVDQVPSGSYYAIPLSKQQLRQVRTILAGDAGNQRDPAFASIGAAFIAVPPQAAPLAA
jgi:hypothetical protein